MSTRDLIAEMTENVNKYGRETMTTYLMVQAIKELQRLVTVEAALRAQVEALQKVADSLPWYNFGTRSAVPEGWPTNEMIEAGRRAANTHGPLLGNGQSLWHVFRDMLAAAPQADAGIPASDANRLLCSVCGEPQFNSPSGPTCANGHGGVEGVEAPQAEATQPDPCPGCIPGGFCKKPTCGRLLAAQKGGA